MPLGDIRRVPLPSWVLDAGRESFRVYGAGTAAWRPAPDFLLAGAKRGSTTSAYFHLLAHPHILPLFPSAKLLPKRRDGKGPHYFDTNFGRGPKWYLSHFPSRTTRRRAEKRLGGPVITGESSPYYLFHPVAAQRAAALVPNAKILFWLRDPVERTYSMWKLQHKNGVEELPFEEALRAEKARTDGEEERIIASPDYVSFAHEFQSYRAQSEYARALSRWLDHFPADQIKVVASEEYYADGGKVLNDVFTFLGLAPLPGSGNAPMLNTAPRTPMAEEVRRELEDHFAPHNADLEALLGRSFPWSGK
jgi:hypothetical protein